MLQRILALDAEVLDRYDTSSLRYIAASGSALGAPLVTATLRRFGPVLYNVYGSTEVSLATIAQPADLLAAPATAGRTAPGSVVRILDEDGQEVGPDVVGRVFVGSGARFDGYTGGGDQAGDRRVAVDAVISATSTNTAGCSSTVVTTT